MPLTKAQEDEVAELYASGERGNGLHALAKRFGVNRHAISRVLEARGISRRPSGAKSPIEGRENEVVAAYKECGSMSSVARQFKTTPAAVKRVLTEAGVRIVPNRGGRPSRQRELLEQAKDVTLERAGADVTCSYRPPAYGAGATSADGDGRTSRGPALREPACGRPVRFASNRDPLCDFHASMAKSYMPTAEDLARRQREELVQSCASCGDSWSTTLLRARVSWAHHVKHCRGTTTPAAHNRKLPRDAEVIRLYTQEGQTVQEIAAAYGLASESSVLRVLELNGVPRRPRGVPVGGPRENRKLPADDVIAALYAEGLTIREIAGRYGATSTAVYEKLRRAGSVMRPPGRPGIAAA